MDCASLRPLLLRLNDPHDPYSVNKVVPKSDVLKTAVEWAQEIVGNSPDSVQSTKRALMLSSQLGDVEDVVVAHTRSKEMLRVYASDNIKVS